MIKKIDRVYLLCVAIVLVLQACTSLQVFPVAARAGDTVTLAVGSAQGMSKDQSNTTAVYVADAGGVYPLTIRSVFNLYPDKRSSLYQGDSSANYVINSSYHEAWQTVMVVDLPTNLPVGTGEIQINSIASLPTISNQINDVPIAIEIIPGVGLSSAFTYEFGLSSSLPGDLSLLEPLPHALVIPPVNVELYGAIEMKFTLPNNARAKRPLLEEEVRVIVDDMTSSTLSNRNVVWGYKNDELIVMLISPTGMLQAMESRFSIVLAPRVSFTSPPVLTEVSFFDENGFSVVGPAATDYAITLR